MDLGRCAAEKTVQDRDFLCDGTMDGAASFETYSKNLKKVIRRCCPALWGVPPPLDPHGQGISDDTYLYCLGVLRARDFLDAGGDHDPDWDWHPSIIELHYYCTEVVEIYFTHLTLRGITLLKMFF